MASSAQIEVLITAVDMASDVMEGIGNAISNIGTAALAAATALAGMATAGLIWSTEQALEAEEAVALLDAVLQATGGSAGLTSQQLQDLATSLQEVTRYSDEEVIAAETILLRFSDINSTVFPEAIRLSADLAAAMGTELPAAAQLLGRALQDPENGVGRLNTQWEIFDKAQLEAIKNMAASGDTAGAQALILEGLRLKIGGVAEALGETTSGQWDIFKNQLSDIGELIGDPILPVLQMLLDKIEGNLPLIEEWAGRIAEFFNGEQFAGFADSVGTLIDDVFTALETGDWSTLTGKFDNLVSGIFEEIGTAINTWTASGGAERMIDAITGWINDAQLPQILSENLKAAAQSMAESMIEAFGEIDWNAIVAAIDDRMADAIRNYDWKKSGENFAAALKESFKFGFDDLFQGLPSGGEGFDIYRLVPTLYYLREFFKTDTGQAIKDALNQWLEGIFGNWADEVKRLWNLGLAEIFNFGPWDMLVALFKRGFGISSPSTVFAAIGRELVLGLIAGWSTAFSLLIAIVTADIAKIAAMFTGAGLGAVFGGGDGRGTGDLEWGTAGTTGTVGGRSTGGATRTSSAVNNYYYGPVYFGAAGEPGAYYDCPDPSPIIRATARSGGGGGGGRR